jgi:hypothetical protein
MRDARSINNAHSWQPFTPKRNFQMNEIKLAGDFQNQIDAEIEDLRTAAAQAADGLRTLRDIEMGWIAGGGDGNVTWV